MSDDRLGDRVIVSELSDHPISGGNPHPQDPWRNASSMDQPFRGAAAPGAKNMGRETPYDPRGGTLRDPLGEAQAARQAPAPSATPAPTPEPKIAKGPRPVPQVAKVTKAESATLRRFREVFGLERVKVEDVTVSRLDPLNREQNTDMVFGLRGVNWEDYQWIMAKALDMNTDPRLAEGTFKIAWVAMTVAHIDGVPIYEVFGFEPSDPDHVRDPMYPHIGLRFQAAELWIEELSKEAQFDLVENLYKLYEAKIDSKYLPKKVKEPKSEEGPQGPLTQTVSGS